MLEIQIRDGHHYVDMDCVDEKRDNEEFNIFKAFLEQVRPDLDFSKLKITKLDANSICVTDIKVGDYK